MIKPRIVIVTGTVYSPSLDNTRNFEAEVEIPFLGRLVRKIWVSYYDNLIQRAIEEYSRTEFPDDVVTSMSYVR